MSQKMITAFCDGACKGNPGHGGWGAAFFVYTSSRAIAYTSYGGKNKTTNQEMELQAMLEVLKLCPLNSNICIMGDSKYVLEGLIKGGMKGTVTLVKENVKFTGRLDDWIANSWKKADKKPPIHLQIWKDIVEACKNQLCSGSVLQFEWVKGHSKNPGNDLADQLANQGAAENK